MDKLQIIKSTRKTAANTLLKTLDSSLKTNSQVSEIRFRDEWLKELRKHPEIFQNGWYDPPKFGMAVLFGSSDNLQRVNMDSLRNEKYWPKSENFLDKENGMAYFFASPVDKLTGIIGDFGINVYFGKNPEIINHLKVCYKIDKEISEKIQIGMKFSEIAKFAQALLIKKGLVSNIVSSTDPVGVNIGHTIPNIFEGWTEEEIKILRNAESDWIKFKNLIRKKRIFVNEVEVFKVDVDMAFTIEPRIIIPSRPNLPMVSFHTIVAIDSRGNKELITEYDRIFRLAGMNYLLP